MEINVTYLQNQSSLPAGFVQDVNYVVSYLDSLFPANVTLNIDVGFQNLGSGVLGESEASQYVNASYAAVRTALQAEGAPGAAQLPASSPFPSSTLSLSIAEAQALDLVPSGGLDGTVWFSSTFPFSYGQNTSPGANQYYFIGVVEHEITEIMGRVSFLSSPYSPIDLYRYSAPGLQDLSTGGSGSTAYFSIDNGNTNLGSWNNDPSNGDLADWYPQGPAPGGNDAFNDYSYPGVINVMSANDITLMQALGWAGTPNAGASGPTVTAVQESPSTGDLSAGHIVSIAINFSSAVTVAGGSPSLTLNDGGSATYVSGSGTPSLDFSYTVQAGQNVAALAVTAVNSNGATIEDAGSNPANLSLAGLTQSGPQIDTTPPVVTTIAATADNNATTINNGHLVTITLSLTEPVTVTGAPRLQLNDSESAVYAAGSGTDTLTFAYVVQTGDSTPDLQATGLNLPNGAAILDNAGNAVAGFASADLGLQVAATASASTEQEINGLYVALYNVPADGPGVAYWTNQILAHDTSLTLASAISSAPISTTDAQFLGLQMTAGSPIMSNGQTYFETLYPATMTDLQYVEQLYQNMAGFEGTSGGIQYWSNQLQTLESQGESTIQAREAIAGQFVHDFISNDLALGAAAWGVSQSDWTLLVAGQQTLLDRVAVSQFWASITASDPNSILIYSTTSSQSFIDGMALLSAITSNPTSVLAAEQAMTAAESSHSLTPIENYIGNATHGNTTSTAQIDSRPILLSDATQNLATAINVVGLYDGIHHGLSFV